MSSSQISGTVAREPSDERVDPASNLSASWLPEEWEGSEAERTAKQSRTRYTWVVGISLLFAFALGLYGLYRHTHHEPAFAFFTSAGLFLYVALLCWFIGLSNYNAAQKKFRDKQELIGSVVQSRQVVQAVEKKLSLEYVIAVNRASMKDYDRISQDQARMSFKHSQFAMLVGLGILAFGVIVALAPNSPAVKITVGALSGIGAGVSGYITKTFLSQHKVAISQINRTYRQPLVSSYLLNAERISENLTDREAMLQSIAAASIGAAKRMLVDPESEMSSHRRGTSRKRKSDSNSQVSNND